MSLLLQATVPSEDRAQKILFSGKANVNSIFPGGTFQCDADLDRRLAFLDRRMHNPKIQEFLQKENSFGPLTPEQTRNLEAAGTRQAVFILTGQQPGLLGGPILWLYKALTCAALAKEWSRRLSRPVIPIFWVAGDDSDLQECNQLELLEAQSSRVSGPLSLRFPQSSRPIPMSERAIDPEEMIGLWKRLAPIWSSGTLDILREAYPNPSTITSGFLRLAQTQLGREGILFVDGYSSHLRAYSQGILQQAIDQKEAYHAALQKGTQAAEAAGIAIQVRLRSGLIHAFAIQNGERQRIIDEPQALSVPVEKATGALILSHDVFTRPLVAEAVFPVLGHVLGPAELRYFAQLAPLFLKTTGDMPLLHPRMTVTVVSNQAMVDFKAQNMGFPELVTLSPSGLRSQLETRIWQGHPAAHAFSKSFPTVFSNASPNDEVQPWLRELQEIYGQYFSDPGVMNGFEKKLNHVWARYIRSLKRMALNEQASQHQKLFQHLHELGNGKGQDRHLYFPSLFQLLGQGGLAELRAIVDPLNPDLQWVRHERN